MGNWRGHGRSIEDTTLSMLSGFVRSIMILAFNRLYDVRVIGEGLRIVRRRVGVTVPIGLNPKSIYFGIFRLRVVWP